MKKAAEALYGAPEDAETHAAAFTVPKPAGVTSATGVWEIPGYLVQMISEEPETVQELLTLFVEDTAASMQALQSAADSGDHNAALKVLHRLKGGCGQMGALPAASLCAALEKNVISGDWAVFMERLPLLHRTIREVQILMTDRSGTNS